MRSVALLLLGLGLTGGACGDPTNPFVTVTVVPAPNQLGTEYVATAVLSAPSGERTQTLKGVPERFGLRLPEGSAGSLRVQVEARRGSCLLSLGSETLTIDPTSRAEMTVKLAVPPLKPTLIKVPETRGAFRGIWGSPESDLWVVGERHATMESRTMILRGKDAADPKWDTSTQAVVKSGVGIFGIYGVSPQDYVAVGVYGNIFRGSPSQMAWDNTSLGGLRTGVWASGPLDIWVVGETFPKESPGTNLLHYDQSKTWQIVSTPFPQTFLTGIYGTSPKSVWVVGRGGLLARYDGSRFAVLPSGTTQDLNGIAGTSDKNLWAVGAVGTILHSSGGAFGVVPFVRPSLLYGVTVLPNGEVWVSGAGGQALRGGTKGFEVVPTGTDQDLFAAFATCETSIWLAGMNGTVVRFSP